jgi:hypothetical protein
MGISADMTQQIVSLDYELAGGSTMPITTTAGVDVTDGQASVHDDTVSLQLTQNADGSIDATGSLVDSMDTAQPNAPLNPRNVTLHFERRAPNALNGPYLNTFSHADGNGVQLTIESSTDESFVFSLNVNGTPIATHANATLQSTLDVFAAASDDGACSFSMTLFREGGRFHVTAFGTGDRCRANKIQVQQELQALATEGDSCNFDRPDLPDCEVGLVCNLTPLGEISTGRCVASAR